MLDLKLFPKKRKISRRVKHECLNVSDEQQINKIRDKTQPVSLQ